MISKRIKANLFIFVVGVLVLFLVGNGISKMVALVDIFNQSEEEFVSDTKVPNDDKIIYEEISKEDLNPDNVQYNEGTFDDYSNIPEPSFDVLNFDVLNKYVKSEKYELQEIYSGINLALMGKLKEDTSFYIKESSIVVDGDYISFDLMYVSSKKPFDTLKLQYRYN